MNILRLAAGSSVEFPAEAVVGQVVAVYQPSGLVPAPGPDGEWAGLLSYFASATGTVTLPDHGLFGFVEMLDYKPSVVEGLHFINGRAMGYTSGVMVPLEQIAADFSLTEEFADYASAVLPRVRTEYERVRSLNHFDEARRLLDFLAAVEPSFERSIELLQLVLELDEQSEEAVPMKVTLSRSNPNDRLVLQLKARATEHRRRYATEAEREGRLADALGAWWDVHHLNPADEEAEVHRQRIRSQLGE